ncbi:MAG: hypothetical protein ACE5JS_15310 [Nitrospinota bacterium]
MARRQHESTATASVDLDQFISAVKAIENFWLTVVSLPPSEKK